MLVQFVSEVLDRSDTLGDAQRSLHDEGIEFYERNGKTTGIKVGNKSYRFKTLGLDHPMLDYLQRKEELDRLTEPKEPALTRSRER